jgi:hypothetical protein
MPISFGFWNLQPTQQSWGVCLKPQQTSNNSYLWVLKHTYKGSVGLIAQKIYSMRKLLQQTS